jgi:hypothetical protein
MADQLDIGVSTGIGGPSGQVIFSPSGPQAVINIPTAPISSLDPLIEINGPQFNSPQFNGINTALPSNGATGSAGNTTYLSGAAPEDRNMSGLTAPITNKNIPSGIPTMTNGLLAPNSVNMAGIPQWYGPYGPMTDGFNTNPLMQTYSMATGTQALINGVINTFGGGFITAGPVLPVTSTGSVDANTCSGNGY